MKSLRDEKPWVLKRQDDNGNIFDMDKFADEAEAEEQRAIFERRGHKQTYFIERKEPKP